MTTRINETGPLPLVESTRTAPRITPAPSEPFRSVMQAGARAVVEGAESAVLQLPGGPVLAAAFRSPAYGTTSAALETDGINSPAEYENYAAEGPSPVATGESASTDSALLMTQNTDQNMYYLKLQQQISDENRQYTALSNVLKARHDTVKNAIGNIR